MDDSELSLPSPPPAQPGGATAADYPSMPTTTVGATGTTTDRHDPFGAPHATPTPHDPFGAPGPGGTGTTTASTNANEGLLTRARRRIGSALAALAALGAKFFAALKGAILLLPKLKVLTTAGTALVSVAAYSLFFGWTFAVGFVVLLFVHEMGHVIQLRREGIRASAPMFVPFMGAFISAKSLGGNALAEARVGLAGPVLGTLGACVCLAIGELTGSDFFRALAYVGFFLNLLNMLPVVPLDGGRAMAAVAPWMWFAGFGVLVALMLLFPNPILLIIVILSVLELYRRWQQRKSGSLAQAAYYRVSPRNRLLVAGAYIGLVVILALGMDVSHILASGEHSFRSL